MIWFEKAMSYAAWFKYLNPVALKAPERSLPRWLQGKVFFRQTQIRKYKK